MKNFNKCLHMCASIGNLPSSYVDSLSYEEQILWICKLLKEEILPAVKDIPSYVDDKIEEMAKSGELESIIEEYIKIKTLNVYDTVNDMKTTDKLINGSFAKTLGYNSKNDGGGSYYKIRTVTNQDVVNNMDIIQLYDESLVAEFIHDKSITPQQFGAKGDSTTDDSTIIKYVIEYAGSHGISVDLIGMYYINNKIDINIGTSVVIYGSKSQIGSLITESNDNYANLKFGNDGYFEINGTTNITFENVGFNGTSKAIILKSFRNRIINCGFNGFTLAISTEAGTHWVGENLIDKCCFNSVGTCIKLNNGSDGDISGNLVDGTCTKFIDSTYDAGYKIENNHDYSKQGSTITGYNVTFVGNYVDGWNKLKITGNSGFNISSNTFIGADPTSGTNCAITFTAQTISSGCITGNNVAKSNNNTQSEFLYFINLSGVSYFSNVTVSGNNTRVCSKVFNGGTGSNIYETNITDNININYYEVASRVHVTQFHGALNGNVVMCHTVATLDAGNTSDVVRLDNICTKWLHIVKMQNDSTMYTFFGDRSITLQGAWANAGGFEAWSFGIRDNINNSKIY